MGPRGVCASVCDWEKSQTSLTPESHSSNTQQTKRGVSAVLTDTRTHCMCTQVNTLRFMNNNVLPTATPYVPRWGDLSYRRSVDGSRITRRLVTTSMATAFTQEKLLKSCIDITVLIKDYMESCSILIFFISASVGKTAAVMCIQIRFEKHKHTPSSQHHSQDQKNSSKAFP